MALGESYEEAAGLVETVLAEAARRGDGSVVCILDQNMGLCREFTPDAEKTPRPNELVGDERALFQRRGTTAESNQQHGTMFQYTYTTHTVLHYLYELCWPLLPLRRLHVDQNDC